MRQLMDDTRTGGGTPAVGVAAALNTLDALPRAVIDAGGFPDDVLTAESFDAFRGWATSTSLAGLDAAALLERARAVEELQRALVVVAADTAMAFDAARRDADAARGVDPERTRKAVVGELALARRVSPNRVARELSAACTASAELWHTWGALRNGDITAKSVTDVLKATAMLGREDRGVVDEALHRGPDGTGGVNGPSALRGMGERQIEATARRLAYDLDPANVVKANAIAESERYVSMRPKPDCMVQLTAVVPMAQGVAAYASLVRTADAARAAGDERSKGQVMADTFLARLTGNTDGDPTIPAPAGVTVNLVMTDTTLFTDASTPATVTADGLDDCPLPAPLARRLVHQCLAGDTRTSRTALRRLYTKPETGQLVAMESTARTFPDGLARFIGLRDQRCATPWCDAPIRHTDHVVPVEENGPTSATNGAGRCERCNHTKQHPDWREEPPPDRPGIDITTPTGLTLASRPDPVLRSLWPQGWAWWGDRTPLDDDADG